jgi:hypothetical protein
MDSLDDSLAASTKISPLKPIAALVVIAGLVGGAWWMYGRGKGQPEDPARVLIIGTTPELVGFLEGKGFEAKHLSFGVAVGEGRSYDASLDDLAAIHEYADWHGFGYVALSMVHGERYDFSAVGFETETPPPGTAYAVMSVGDLGNHLRYGAVVPELDYAHAVDERIGLLLALFAQPELGKVRTREASNDLMIRFDSAGTVDDVIAYEKAQDGLRRQIKAWNELARRERGEPLPREIAGPYERVLGWPLANGSVLLAAGRGAWRSDDGLRSVWVGDDLRADLSVIANELPVRRRPCDTLPDTLLLDGGFAVAAAGDALLIPSNAYVADLWVLSGDGCGFEKRDEIRRLEAGALGQPRKSGRTATARNGRLMWADAKMRAYRHARVVGIDLHDDALRWLDDHTVVVAATLDFTAAPTSMPGPLPANGDALVFVRLPEPGVADELELTVVPLEAGETLRELFTLAEPPAAVAWLDTPRGPGLIRVTLNPGADSWRNGLDPYYDLAVAARVGQQGSTREALTERLPTDALDLTVSPTGSHAAWATSGGEDQPEIFVLALGTPEAAPRRLTDNDRRDLRPRFAGDDGRLLIFDSLYPGSNELPAIESLRAVAVPE